MKQQYFIKEISAEHCVGCEKCVSVCPHNCIEMGIENDKPVAIMNNHSDCDFCGKCIAICSEKESCFEISYKQKPKTAIISNDRHTTGVDASLCNLCNKCVIVCPEHNFEEKEKDGKIVMSIIDSSKCNEDCYCGFVCQGH